MTDPVVSSYPGYATPTFHFVGDGNYFVVADPGQRVGVVKGAGAAGWIALNARGHYVGLLPDKQAAGEALVRHAGYEVL